MKASEARELMELSRKKMQDTKMMDIITQKIQDAAKRRQNCIVVSFLDTETKKALEGNGYEVKETPRTGKRDLPQTIISW